MGHGNKRWAQAAVPAFLDRILTAASRSNGFKYSKPGRWMKYRPGADGQRNTVHPASPGARSRARRAVALSIAGVRSVAGPSANVISAAGGHASALESAPPLAASSSAVAADIFPRRRARGQRRRRRPPGRHRPAPSRALTPPAAPPRRGVPAPRDLGPSRPAPPAAWTWGWSLEGLNDAR